jgi:hypothetical protein
MANATVCDNVQIKYRGDGSTTLFTFPFTYMHWYDIHAYLWDEERKDWIEQKNKFILANATTVEFLTAPPPQTQSCV